MQTFELTTSHVKLLRAANVMFSDVYEWGGPAFDFKRPFGNGDMVGDMAKIIGVEPVETDDEEIHWPKGTADEMTKLYAELETALQIVLFTGSFEPGRYVTEDYRREWNMVSLEKSE